MKRVNDTRTGDLQKFAEFYGVLLLNRKSREFKEAIDLYSKFLDFSGKWFDSRRRVRNLSSVNVPF